MIVFSLRRPRLVNKQKNLKKKWGKGNTQWAKGFYAKSEGIGSPNLQIDKILLYISCSFLGLVHPKAGQNMLVFCTFSCLQTKNEEKRRMAEKNWVFSVWVSTNFWEFLICLVNQHIENKRQKSLSCWLTLWGGGQINSYKGEKECKLVVQETN